MARLITVLFALVLILAACSTSDSGTGDTTANAGTVADTQAPPDTQAAQPSAVTVAQSESPATEAGATATDATETAAGTPGTGTVTLENGELFEFTVQCVLGPVDSAHTGRDLLLSVDSYDDTQYNLTASVFGPDQYGSAPLSMIQIWSMSENEIAWGAYSASGGQVDLRIDGETILGSASFKEGGNSESAGVQGDLVAYC